MVRLPFKYLNDFRTLNPSIANNITQEEFLNKASLKYKGQNDLIVFDSNFSKLELDGLSRTMDLHKREPKTDFLDPINLVIIVVSQNKLSKTSTTAQIFF